MNSKITLTIFLICSGLLVTAQDLKDFIPKSSRPYKIVNDQIRNSGFFFSDKMVQLEWNGASWDSVFLTLYTNVYSNGNYIATDETTLERFGSGWLNTKKSVYSYEGNNNLLEEVDMAWWGGVWNNEDKWSYTYNANNQVIEEFKQEWDGNWQNSERTTYTYTNNLLTATFKELWDGTAWVNNWRSTRTYNSNNLLDQVFNELWYDGAWISVYISTFQYDQNNLPIDEVIQHGNGSENYEHITWEYYPDLKLKTELTQFWTISVWRNSSRSTYLYNENGNLYQNDFQQWSGTSWDNYQRFIFLYRDYSGVDKHQDISDLHLINYPNPFTSATSVAYMLDKTEHITLSIYDLTGKKITTLVDEVQSPGKYELQFDPVQKVGLQIEKLNAGMYIAELKAGKKVYRRHMIQVR